jgi:hypothetical protein
MKSRINTYEDLLDEQKRLQLLLQTQKDIVRQDIREIKEELAPIKTAVNFIGKLTTRDSGNPLINSTVNTAIDLLIRKVVLGRAGWITKLVVPFIIKNFASHAIDEKKDSIIQKLFSWFGKKKKEDHPDPATSNGKLHPVEEE